MFKVLGITDERDFCECCGKKNLKRVVVLQNGTDVMYYGTDCAAKALTSNDKAAKRMNTGFIDAAKNMDKIQAWINKYGAKGAKEMTWNRIGYICEVKGDSLHVRMLDTVLVFNVKGE